jgi:hypothetical protein
MLLLRVLVPGTPTGTVAMGVVSAGGVMVFAGAVEVGVLGTTAVGVVYAGGVNTGSVLSVSRGTLAVVVHGVVVVFFLVVVHSVVCSSVVAEWCLVSFVSMESVQDVDLSPP